MSATIETLEFKTELKQLMEIIIHSLYANKEVYLRELISNASDAIDKARFEGLTHPEVLEENADWKIKLTPDKAARTLTVSDNGIGMSRESIVEDLGTIARSGTQAFLQNLKQQKLQEHPELIGQFGVGFYAAFMVADKVTVVSRRAGDPSDGVRWESDGQGTFTVEQAVREARGTDVILHLKEDAAEFLDPWKLRATVKQFSDFIEHPVVMDVEKEGETVDADGKKNTVVAEGTLNKRQAIWLRPKGEIGAEEYTEFYKHLTRHWDEPARTIHYSAEGVIEFKALLFVPGERPMDFFMDLDRKSGLHLYIRRVFIMDDCDRLLPPWLRFVKGVVDASDLPLNVSRETIQENRLLDKIRKNLTGKVLATLEEMKKNEREKYEKFFAAFGPVIKEGVASDHENREKLADLLLAESTKTEPGKPATLREVRERMPEQQDAIYYLIGESRAQLEASPCLEAFRARDWEVLLLTEPIDEWTTPALAEYDGKPLKAADRGELPTEEPKAKEEQQAAFKDYLSFLKEKLGEEVADVRLSNRLKESAACLVADEGTMGAHMERLFKKMGREAEAPPSRRILELNPEHATVVALHGLFEKDKDDARLEDFGWLLYDEALLAEGSALKDPKAFARRVNTLMAESLIR
jgi:molecular chaperone HtpG